MKRSQLNRPARISRGSWIGFFGFTVVGLAVLLYGAVPALRGPQQSVARSNIDLSSARNASAVEVSPKSDTPLRAGRRPIESIQVGDRVLAHNPELTDAERAVWSEPDWQHWIKLSLVMPKPDGSQLNIEMLRPESWVIAQIRFVVEDSPVNYVEIAADEPVEQPRPGASVPFRPVYHHLASHYAAILNLDLRMVGLTVEMDLPELGLTGEAFLVDIQPHPSVDAGGGSVVTATFHHSSGDTINLVIEDEGGEAETLGTTSNHPFWSVDREEYVQAGALELGERVLTFAGNTKRVTSKLARPGPEPVFNLEVHAEHVYFVGKGGVLVHNSGKTYGTVYKRNAENYVGSAKKNAKTRYGSDDVATDVIKGIPEGDVKPHDVTRGVEQIVLEIGGGANSRGNISTLTNLKNAVDPNNTAIYAKGLTKYQYRVLKGHEFLKQKYGNNYRETIRRLFDFDD